ARLDSGVDVAEIDLAKQLLNAYRARNPQIADPQLGSMTLRPLPIDGADVSLGVGLRQYAIPQDKIAIVALSDVLGEIDVSWITDPTTKDMLQLALSEDVGINGSVTFKPTGGAIPSPQIPVTIQLADPGTFGLLRWRRDEAWRNSTPYPLRLRYLHALMLENNVPIIYSWDLGDREVPPLAQV